MEREIQDVWERKTHVVCIMSVMRWLRQGFVYFIVVLSPSSSDNNSNNNDKDTQDDTPDNPYI
jgi:hypothetical protein